MARTKPLFRNCCLIPLKLCLFSWGLFKMIASTVTAVYIAKVAINLYSFNKKKLSSSFLLLYALIEIAIFVDIALQGLMVYGLFKNKSKYLKIYYFYLIYLVTAETIVIIALWVSTFNSLATFIWNLYFFVGIAYICTDICILFTTNSEIIKMKNKEQYDVVKAPMFTKDEDVGKYIIDEEK